MVSAAPLQAVLRSALETRSAALLARCASAVRQAAHEQLSALARALHADPTHTNTWYLAALVATQAAAGSGGGDGGNGGVRGDWQRALGWCKAAAAALGGAAEVRGLQTAAACTQRFRPVVMPCMQS